MPAPPDISLSTRLRACLRFLLPARAWLIVAGAFLAGLLLFLVIWLIQRVPHVDEPTATPLPAAAQHDTDLPALPAPLPPDADANAPGEEGEIGGVFVLPEPSALPPSPQDGLTDPATQPLPAAGTAPVSVADSGPVPVHAPAPRYPRASLRRRESGEVLVRVVVRADGRPGLVEVARSSSYPALDRAAVDAVRNWRFEPARQQGEAVAQSVRIPVEFSP